MELTLREFEHLNLYSHKNMEKVIRKLVNESYNAALTSMFDDSLILFDHTEGKFYAADYDFDEKDLILTLENFEEVQLIKEEQDFEDAVGNFFEDEDMTPNELVKSYKENIVEQEKYIDELISNVISTKSFTNKVDYKKIKEAKEAVVLESTGETFYNVYEERLLTHPQTQIKYFDWQSPVRVSLMETERRSLINSSVVEKAKNMWKRGDFKEQFIKASEELMEGSDEAMLVLFESFPVLFHLAEEDRLAVFGKTLLSSPLRENRKEVVSEIEDLINFDENFAELKDTYLVEEDEFETEEKPEEVEKETKKLELTELDMDKLKKDLKAILGKLEDGEEKDKLADVVERLEASKEEGTKPADVKEAVSILSL